MSSLNNNTVLTGASIHCRSSPSRNPHICNNPLAKAIEDNIKTDKKTNYKYLCDKKIKLLIHPKNPLHSLPNTTRAITTNSQPFILP
jgi:hypothetical protein